MDFQTSTDQEEAGHNLTDQGSSDPVAAPRPADLGTPTQEASALGLDEYLENGYDYEAPKRGDIRTGVIVDVNDNGLVVDIGFKREGFVPAEDLTRLDDETRAEVTVGVSVPVFVLRPENREGHPILSIHQARLYKDWIRAEEMMQSGELYEGEVAGYNRGGVIVKFGKIRGFVPASQVVGLPRRMREDQRRQRMEAMIGDRIGLKIIEVDRMRRRLIFSQRRALRAWQEVQRERVMSELIEGETRRGKVTSITNFGAFVDLGGADGLIHVSELSWGRVDNPRQVLKVGDELDVYVLDVDRERKRIALSLKKLQPDPWTLVDDHYHVGQLIEGQVTRVLDFGAFVEVDLGIEGLLHSSEMIGTPELNPKDIVRSGEKLLVKIIRIDSRRRRLALSARQVRRSEWEHWVAEQQAAHEVAEEEAEVPETEVALSEAIEEQAAVLEAGTEQVEIGEVTEEAAEVPEAELAVGEAIEEGTEAPGTETTEVAEEAAEVPEAELAVGEAIEGGAEALEAETTEVAEEAAEVPEAELAVSEAIEEGAEALEAETTEVAEEAAEVPEAELAVGEAIEEGTEALEAETTEVAEEAAEVPEAELAVGEAIEEGTEAPGTEITEVAEEESVIPALGVGADL